jgi:SMC interacting uncharacterized protein involved in chromosome segregation
LVRLGALYYDDTKDVFTMAFLGLGKKKKQTLAQEPNEVFNHKGESLSRLTDKGELPWGWLAHNKAFIEDVKAEYNHYLTTWLESRSKDPTTHVKAVNSFVRYLEELEKTCQEKGECFAYWFEKVLLSPGYLDSRRMERNLLHENFTKIEGQYNGLQAVVNDRLKKVDETKEEILQRLKENDGILQDDFIKLYEKVDQKGVRDFVYVLISEGRIKRTKSVQGFVLRCAE